MRIKELIQQLQQFDPEAEVFSSGADCGGYDVTYTFDIEIYVSEPGRVYVGGKDDDSIGLNRPRS